MKKLEIMVIGLAASVLGVGCADTGSSQRQAKELESRLAASEAEKSQLGLEVGILEERARRAEATIPPVDSTYDIERNGHNGGMDILVEPKIDAVITRMSATSDLVFISAGAKGKVQVGYKFTVYRDSRYLAKLVVDHVEENWSACHELKDFHKDDFGTGETVSTRVFD